MLHPTSSTFSQGGDGDLSLVAHAAVHAKSQLQRWLEEVEEKLKLQEHINAQEKHRVDLLTVELDSTKFELDAATKEGEDQVKRFRSLEKTVWQLQARETELTNELRNEQGRWRCERWGGELKGSSGSGVTQAGLHELKTRLAQVEAQHDDVRRERDEALQAIHDAEQEILRTRMATLKKEEDLAQSRQDAHELYAQSEELQAQIAAQNQQIIPLRFRIAELEEHVASLRSASPQDSWIPQEPSSLAMELCTGDGGQALLEQIRELEEELRDREARRLVEAAEMEEMRQRLQTHQRDNADLHRMLERAQSDVEAAIVEKNTEAKEVLRLRDALAHASTLVWR